MQTQFFLNCAHVNIVGPGGGNLDSYPSAKFPGAYDYMDPRKSFRCHEKREKLCLFPKHYELAMNLGIYTSNSIAAGSELFTYIPPGPPLWEG